MLTGKCEPLSAESSFSARMEKNKVSSSRAMWECNNCHLFFPGSDKRKSFSKIQKYGNSSGSVKGYAHS